jgi:hypothetical protein
VVNDLLAASGLGEGVSGPVGHRGVVTELLGNLVAAIVEGDGVLVRVGGGEVLEVAELGVDEGVGLGAIGEGAGAVVGEGVHGGNGELAALGLLAALGATGVLDGLVVDAVLVVAAEGKGGRDKRRSAKSRR